MNNCDDCGHPLITGICKNCGLVSDNYTEFDYGDTYPYDKDDKSFSYGGARTHSVSDISVMTRVNKAECQDANLRRILQWDRNYGWEVQKIEIINQEVRKICDDLGLDQKFLTQCYYVFRMYREVMRWTGKRLENIASAIVYLMIRLYNKPYTLLDFEKIGYKRRKTYNIYKFLIKKLDLWNLIVPQDPEIFVLKFINEFLDGKSVDFENKRELAIWIIKFFKRFIERHNNGEIDDPQRIGLGGLGACIYLACKNDDILDCSQTEIADICGCSEVTVREYIEKIKRLLKNED